MLIYKITSPNTDIVYVGVTTGTLKLRLIQHHSAYKGFLAGKSNKGNCTSYKVLEHGDAVIELIEETDDASREYHWINTIDNTCNERRRLFDQAAYDRARPAEKKEKRRAMVRVHYAENKEEINAKRNRKEPCSNCGRVVSHNNMAQHQKSKRCQEHGL